MQRILALDLSTSRTGLALFVREEPIPKLVEYAVVEHDDVIASYGAYPFSFVTALSLMADRVTARVEQLRPDIVVIEETNSSKARYTQKALEMLHCLVLQRLQRLGYTSETVKYISTGVWRKAAGIELTKEQKKQNTRLSAAKRRAKMRGEKLDKAELGIVGKVTKKHIAVTAVNLKFGLTLKKKDNDIAEAILLGLAYALGAAVCNGK